jgi:peptide/nickel transport system substrate-binding protein
MSDSAPSRVRAWHRVSLTSARRTRRLAAVMTAAVLALPALTAASSAPPAQPHLRTLTVGLTQDVDSLNPFVGILSASYEIYQLAYDTLTEYGAKDFSPRPGLASSWSTSKDGRTWTYKIRSGVKWSDGVPLTARDVAYTFNRVMHGSFEQTNYGSYVANIASVTAPNDTTVVMRTKTPSPQMLHLLVYILPEHIWKNVSEKQVGTYKNVPMVGSGPFVFDKRQTGQFTRMRANPHYWGGAPHVDQVVFRIFNDDDALTQALRKGEIDFADSLEGNLYRSLAGAPNITRVPAIYSGFDEIGMNTGAATSDGTPIGNGNPVLKDKRIRQAIAWAIDRKTLVRRVLNGYGSVGSTIIPPIYSAMHYEPPPGEAYTYDPAKANQILDQAGYRKDASGIRVDPKTGKEIALRLFARSDSQSSRQSCQFVQNWLHDIGFRVTVKVVSEDSLTEIIGNGEYDLFEWGWVVEPDPDYQLSTMTCGQRSTKSGKSYTPGLSDSFYCNPAFDALYNKQKTQIDPAQRAQTVKAAEKILYDDAPYALTYYYDDLEAYRSDRFGNWTPQPQGKGALLFQYGTYSYLSIKPVSDIKPASSSSSSGSVLPWVGVGVLVVLVAGGGVALTRRRATADERE